MGCPVTQKRLHSPVFYLACLGAGFLYLFNSAAYADNCTGTYTYTYSGSGSSYNLNAAESLKIASGTFTGSINNFPATSTICVETGATFTPSTLNNVAGKLLNYGTSNLQTFSFNAGTVIDNYGTLNFTAGLNTNGATTFYNRANASMGMTNSFQLGNNSTFTNDGLLIAQQDFNTQNGTTLTNNYRLELNGNFNPDGVVNNYGRVYAKKFMNINSSSTVTNYCTLVSYDGFNNNSPRMSNQGTLLITSASGTPGGLWQNNQAFANGSTAKIAGGSFTNNSTFSGGGSLIFSGETRNQGAFTGNSSDKINFYDETQTGSQYFDYQNITPTNTTRVAFTRPTELDAPSTCTSSYKAFAAPSSCTAPTIANGTTPWIDEAVAWTHNAGNPTGSSANHLKPTLVNSSLIASAADESVAGYTSSNSGRIDDLFYASKNIVPATLSTSTYVQYSFTTQPTLSANHFLYGVGLAVYKYNAANSDYSGVYKLQVKIADNASFTSPTALRVTTPIQIDHNNPTTGAVTYSASGDYYFNHYNVESAYQLQAGKTYYVRFYLYDDTTAGKAGGTNNRLILDDVNLKAYACNAAGVTKNISGKVFDDVNYGGDAGRPPSAAGTAGVSGARVELYDSTGKFVSNTTTDSSGAYTLTGNANASYYVRVVNDTVKSSRAGSNGTERGIQTYRSNGSTATTSEVGGRKPASVDATANTSNQTLDTSTFLLSGGGQTQSVQPVSLASSHVSGVDFGFNFSTVVNTNDSGQGSLRQGILNANLLANTGLAQTGQDNTYGVDTTVTKEVLLFNIPATGDPLGRTDMCGGSVCKITVSSQLTNMTAPLIVDGSTQPGYVAGTPGVPRIQIVPATGLDARGLTVYYTATDTTVRALAITGFRTRNTNVAIDVQAERTIVESCYLGITPDGIAAPNGSGIQLEWTQSARIGGTTTAKRNIISGNLQNGIFYDTGASGGTIQNNFIGTNPAGNAAIGNQGRGIDTEAGAGINILDNVISGNWGNGIETGFSGGSGGANNITIRGNRIGVGINGEALGNSGPGIMNYGGSSRHQITQNIIGHNLTGGIRMDNTNVGNVVISQNAIYANGNLGIDLGNDGVTLNDASDSDTGANSLLNFPLVAELTSSSGNLTIKGCAPAGATVELFEADVSTGGKATPGDNRQGKSKDYGEGQTYLGNVVEGSAADTDSSNCALPNDADGNNTTGMKAFAVTLPIPAGFALGELLTATATVSGTGTSEFSPVIAHTLAVTYTLSGTVFEDVTYGGGNGRALGTAGTTVVNGVRVELYDANGTFVSTTTTGSDGTYSFSTNANSSYYVRVVNSTVKSTRSGTDGTERGIQTYRTNGTTAVADEVGGRNPALVDATANTTSQTLNTSTFKLSGGEQVQSVQTASVTNGNLTGVDFGFNFSTIVNTNDSGQGSLRQFILNSNLLAKTGLTQDLPAALATEYTTGTEVSIFMIPASLLGNGIATISPQTELPVSSKGNVAFDGRTQTLNKGDSNTGTVGETVTVGIDKLAVAPVNRPEVALDCSAYPDHSGAEYCMSIAGVASQVHGFAFYGADTGNLDDPSAALYIKPTATSLISGNLFGTMPDGTEPVWAKQNWRIGLLVEGASNVTANHFAYNGYGVIFNTASTAGSIFTANQMNENGPNVDKGALNGSEDGDGMAVWGRAEVTIEGNYIRNSRGRNDGRQGGGNGNIDHGNLIEVTNAGKALIRNNTLINGFVANIGVYNASSNVRIEYNVITAARGTGRSPTGSGVLVNPLGKNPDPVIITRNSIFANNGLGIDLDPGNQSQTGNRVTKNDARDSDSGPNDLLNFPFITAAYLIGGNLKLAGCAPANADIEVFEADVSPGGTDAPGVNKFGLAKDYGEGQIYLTTLQEGVSGDADTSECGHISDSDGNNNRGMQAFLFTIPIPDSIVEGDVLTTTATLAGVGTSEFSLVSDGVVHVTYDISGTVFEDVHYGGNAGRPLSATGTRGINDALVELYDATTGKLVTSVRTANNGTQDGSYLFADAEVNSYYVRVVNETVSSSRSGANGTEQAVQTFRSDGVTDVTHEVGGHHPAETDASAQQGSSLLDPDTFRFVRGPLNGDYVQTLQYINLHSTDISGVDFGFNFNTVVNTQAAGQGSLHQAILNANLLGDDASLLQSGRVAGKENILFMLQTDDANRITQEGVAYWTLKGSKLPDITAPLVMDGATQPGFGSKPVVEISGTSSGAGVDGIRLNTGSDGSLIRNLGINSFSAAGIRILNSTHHQITRNFIGVSLTNNGGKGNMAAGVVLDNASNNRIGGTGTGDGNTIGHNNGDGIAVLAGSTGNALLGNAIFSNNGLGIDLGDNGVTANDPLDADLGANDLLNYPAVQLNSFSLNGTKVLTYDFDLDVPHTTHGYRLEFFKNTQKDSSGYGEGQIYLGYKELNHPGTGSLNVKGTLNANQTLEVDDLITATLTAKTGTDEFGSTSEFSGTQAGTRSSICTSLFSNPTDSLGNMVIDENTALVTLLEARDANGDPITYVISGGADGKLFAITTAPTDPTIDCKAIQFIDPKIIIVKSADAEPTGLRVAPPGYLPPPGDYEAPTDSNRDNVYDFEVTATDIHGKQTVQKLSTHVINVNEAPFITSAAEASMVEETGTLVLDITAKDTDNDVSEGHGLHYSISGGVDARYFTVDAASGILRFRVAPDHDAPADAGKDNTYEVGVTVTDSGGLSGSKQFKVTVTNKTDDDGVVINARARLQGAYDTSSQLMGDELRTQGLLPISQPYQPAPFHYAGQETLNSLLLETTGPDAVVDWLLLELRSVPATLVAQRAVLLQRDGDLVDAQTGTADLPFAGVKAGGYYVSVRHRNHLGVITDKPLALTSTASMIDFSLASTPVKGVHPRLASGETALLWAGDLNDSNSLTANGPGNDVTSLLGKILGASKNREVNTNYALYGYLPQDLNMDGKCLFTGPGNDLSLLIGNILLHPDNVSNAANYIVKGGIP